MQVVAEGEAPLLPELLAQTTAALGAGWTRAEELRPHLWLGMGGVSATLRAFVTSCSP
eukprot:SAG11_NODE_2678_length_3105_cov_2.120758_2_plen_58_part_00